MEPAAYLKPSAKTGHYIFYSYIYILLISEIICSQVAISHANVTMLPESSYPTPVVVTCDAGYELPGGSPSYTAQCQVNAEWSQADSCIGE